MRLTRAAEYAVRCVLYLAKKGKGVLVGRNEVASNTDTPPQFLAKIAQQLARSGIIEILQGAGGGFRLLKEPAGISLLEVIESIIGEISLNGCVTRPDCCTNSATCTVHLVWNRARNQLRATLQEASFAQLAEETSCCFTAGIGIQKRKKV